MKRKKHSESERGLKTRARATRLKGVLMLSLLLSLFAIAIKPTLAQQEAFLIVPTFPENPLVVPGDTFFIYIYIDDVTDLGSFDFTLSYDTSVLTATSYTILAGDPLGGNGFRNFFPTNEINDAAGYVRVGADRGPSGLITGELLNMSDGVNRIYIVSNPRIGDRDGDGLVNRNDVTVYYDGVQQAPGVVQQVSASIGRITLVTAPPAGTMITVDYLHPGLTTTEPYELVQITVSVDSRGITTLDLHDSQILDVNMNPINTVEIDGSFDNRFQGHLAAPDYVNESLTPGDEFGIVITADNVRTPTWGISFWLDYDTNVLTAETGIVDDAAGTTYIQLTDLSLLTTDPVPLVTVTFMLDAGNWSQLHFRDVTAVSIYGDALTFDSTDGSVTVTGTPPPPPTDYTRMYLPNQWVTGGVAMGWYADDSSWSYTLPFDFPFYGIYYRTIYISSNGLITFTGPDSSYSNSISWLASKLAIAVAWDDWVTYSPLDIYIWQPDPSHVIVRWDARHLSTGAAANFEAILGQDGVIQFNYGYSDGAISSTVGISNGVDNIQAEDIVTSNYIHSILFTPYRPEHDLEVGLDAPLGLRPQSSAVLNATVINLGLDNETNVELQIQINDSIVSSLVIPELFTGSSYTLSYTWTPTTEGTYNVTAYALPVPNENVTSNNMASKFVIVAQYVKAAVLDSWGTDYYTGTWQTLNTYWQNFGNTMIMIDYTTLNKENITYDDLVASEADVLVVSCAYAWQFTDEEIAAITRYVEEGHGLIATAGTLYAGVPNNNKLAPLFGLSQNVSWTTTYTRMLDILEPTHPLFINIPNPYNMPDRGTAIPYDYSWDSNELTGGTYLALGPNRESAIVINNGLVYISPWVENMPTTYDLQLLYNAVVWSRYVPPLQVITSPETGLVGTLVTLTGSQASPNAQIEIYWDITFLGTTTADADGNFSFTFTVPSAVAGIHNVKAVETTTHRSGTAEFIVVPSVRIDPTSGPVGTKLTVNGYGFAANMPVQLTFDDTFTAVLLETDGTGSFTATINVPIAVSGPHTIKAFSYAELYAEDTFTVIDITTLEINIDGGNAFFTGETAEFYMYTVVDGWPADATLLNITLYKPDGSTETLTAQRMATGLYEIRYTLSQSALTGTYTLVVEAYYVTGTMNAHGACIKSFIVEQTVIKAEVLEVNLDVGALFFKGETAEFYAQTAFNGKPIDVTTMNVRLYMPNGTATTLTYSRNAIGLYKILFTIRGKGSMIGTYTLVVETGYTTSTVNANGTSIKTFIVKSTWEKEAPRIAALSIASIGLVSAMIVLWRKEKKRYL